MHPNYDAKQRHDQSFVTDLNKKPYISKCGGCVCRVLFVKVVGATSIEEALTHFVTEWQS